MHRDSGGDVHRKGEVLTPRIRSIRESTIMGLWTSDTKGMVIPETVNRADPFEARVSIAQTLQYLAPQLSMEHVERLFRFFIERQALGDRNAQVRQAMLNAAIAIIEMHGAQAVSDLMRMFELELASSAGDSGTSDYIKEAVIIVSLRRAALR